MKTLYIHNEISAFAEATEIKARSVSKKHMFFYFPYIFCCILFLGSSFNVYSQNAQISTDKPSYFPGEQVQIVGTDFQPNEPVQLVIQKIGTPENNDTINTVADQYGDINLTNYTISASDDNTLYTLEASGDISAAAAETTFNGKMGLAQSHNGGIGEPVIDPVIWVNGNANAQNSHYLEGNSIPYRVILNDVEAGTHTIRIKWDIMHGGKHAIDYITSYQRNDAEGISETVDPRSDLPAGVLADPTFFLIPTPASMDVAGKPQPSSSFLSLPAQDRAMACFNGTILSMEYVSEGSFLDDNSTTEIEITYNVPSGPTYVMFAWGGHIAKRTDWGPGSSCASINGSPYHTALGISDFITGAQDRSLKTDAVQFFPTCALDVPDNACPGDVIIATATTDAPSPHFTFSATNGAIISVSGPEDNTAEITVPDGDFVVSVMIVDFFDGQVISEESNCEDSVQVNEVPDAAILTDDDPDCEDNTGAYHVASGDGFTYAWSLSGNASFVGASDGSSVQVLVDDVCNANFELSVVVDNNGCVDSSALEVEFADSIPPVISEGPGDDATIACPAEPEFDAPSASDDCSAATIHQLDDDVDQGDCDGEYVVTRGWYFTDACGNSTDTVYQTITVVDTIAPSINEDAGDDETIACPAEPEFDAPSASDECSQATIHQLEDDVDQGDCDGEYVVTRGWYFTDDCGNSSDTVYQTITVVDTLAPTINEDAGDDATIACPAEPEFDAPSASDECSSATIHQLDDDVDQGDCDGEYVVTRGWYFTDDCGNVSDTVYQVITVVDTIAPTISDAPGDDATIACPAEPEFDAPSASDECSSATIHQLEDDVDQGDCDGEYVITRGWYFTDDCGNVSDTVYQVITVVDTIAPSITEDAGDDEVIACGEDAEFDAPSASDECSAATIHQLEDDIDEGDCASEMTITRGWYFTDDCGNVSDTVYQVISVVDSIAPALSGTGDDYEIDCHEEAVFTAPNVLDNCSEFELIADGPDSLEVDGNIQITMSWYAVDACGNASDTVDQVITVNACNEVFCSLTQGFYGNAKGIACATGERGKDLLARILGPEFGPLVIGSGSRTLTFNSGDVECLIKVMPAGGPSVILPSGNNSFGANCSLPADFLSKPGRLKSVVWGQVITLGLNLRYDVDLGDVQLGGNQFITGEASPGDDGLCGTEDDVFEPGDGLVKQIPQSVLDALDDLYGGDRSIYNLFLLANRVLGGEAIAGVSVGDINAAASAINEGFDECRFLEGFDDTKDLLPAENEELEVSSEMNYKVFPNPFNDATTIAFVTNESMNVQVEVFAINGDKVATLYNDYATANTEYRVVLNGAQLQNGVYFVRILSDGGVYETRIILNK